MMEMLMRGGRVAMILLNSFDEYESIILDVFMRHGCSIFGYSLANFYTQIVKHTPIKLSLNVLFIQRVYKGEKQVSEEIF